MENPTKIYTTQIKDFIDEVPLICSKNRIVMLEEFHVPEGYNANDFGIEIKARYGDTYRTFYADKTATKDLHIVDLSNNLVEKVALMSVKIYKPVTIKETEILMTIRYQLR